MMNFNCIPLKEREKLAKQVKKWFRKRYSTKGDKIIKQIYQEKFNKDPEKFALAWYTSGIVTTCDSLSKQLITLCLNGTLSEKQYKEVYKAISAFSPMPYTHDANKEFVKHIEAKVIDRASEWLAMQLTKETQMYFPPICATRDECTIKFINNIGAYERGYYGENIPCPTIDEVLDWLRVNKEVDLVIKPSVLYDDNLNRTREYNCDIFAPQLNKPYHTSYHGSYELAALVGIEYVLDNLI